MDWAEIFEKLKTENIISYVSSFDLISLASNPYVIVSVILVLCLLIFFKFVRTLAVLVGIVAICLAITHSFPEENQELVLLDIAILGGTCFLVAVSWIYVFFLRSD
jgi:asparagine N-glycosylation enzyme membrane subunit Stt3